MFSDIPLQTVISVTYTSLARMVRNVQMWSVVTSVNARVVSRERIATKVSFTQETRSKPITISLSRTLIKRLLYSTRFFFTDLIKAGLCDAPAWSIFVI